MGQLKFSLILSLFILFNLGISAQDYTPMAVENATWIMDGLGESYYVAWAYRISGDTIVENLSYKKVYGFGLDVVSEHFDFPKKYEVSSSALSFLMRDDIEERKVYVRKANEWTGIPYKSSNCEDQVFIEEQMLYDFSLTVGDSIQHCMIDYSDLDYSVIEIDSSEEVFGLNRRVLSGWFDSNEMKLIESIGFTGGLLNANIIYPPGFYLSSFCIGTEWDCQLHTSSEDFVQEDDVIIYPNPVSDKLNIEADKTIKKVFIYDAMGALVLKKAGNIESINTENLKSGLYILCIRFEHNNGLHRETFIKY